MSSILVPYENSNLEIDSCYNITIPKGTDAQRTHASFSLKEGALRYNTTSNVLEFYNSSSWVSPAINLTGLSDVGTATATCGNLLIGGGASFSSQAITGDVTLSASGAITITSSFISGKSEVTHAVDDFILYSDIDDSNNIKKVALCDVTVKCAVSSGSSSGGSVDSANQLTNARDFSITGDVTAAAVSFNGTADVTLSSSISGLEYSKMEAQANAPTWNQSTTGNANTATTATTAGTVTTAAQPAITSVGTLVSATLSGALTVASLGSNPGTTAGMIFFDTGTNKFKGYDGSNWVDFH